MSRWTDATKNGKVATELTDRPMVPATFHGNITVQGSWVEKEDMTQTSLKFGRTVNNVSLAFPHPGVVTAAHDGRNGFPQPDQADLGVR